MPGTELKVGVDSMALTYLVLAMQPSYDPAMDDERLAEERIAIFRLYLHTVETFFVPPTVLKEYQPIRDSEWREQHRGICEVLLFDYPWKVEEQAVDQRKEFYLKFHNKEKDCQMVAESEIGDIGFGGLDVLLTNDDGLLKHLSGKTQTLNLIKPSEYWQSLAIPKGTRPRTVPHATNPLAKKTWWKW